MSSASIREPASFGKRKEPHTIVVTRNGKSRQFTIHPAVFSVMVGTVFMFLFGYFGATAYLIFRDDMISASYTRQARMQHEYEDRIAALRSKLDRVTSRQLLDQQAIETQVRELLARQDRIGGQAGKMQNLLQEAHKRGLETAKQAPVTLVNPNAQSESGTVDRLTTGSLAPRFGDATSFSERIEYATNAFHKPALSSNFTQELFGGIAESIRIIDSAQRQQVDSLRIAAAKRTVKIGEVLKSVGVNVKQPAATATGGPFVPLDHSVDFETHLTALENTLNLYDAMAAKAKTVPIGNPVPGAKISSRYGSRVDPFNGRMAMHGGIDFKAKRGTPIKATAKGVVIKAGRNGGYGKVVEIRHQNGYTTRYAHLSRISVQIGQHVNKDEIVGKVGSTGRSTGPHLHYEVRRSDKTRNPATYMKAGKKISGLL